MEPYSDATDPHRMPRWWVQVLRGFGAAVYGLLALVGAVALLVDGDNSWHPHWVAVVAVAVTVCGCVVVSRRARGWRARPWWARTPTLALGILAVLALAVTGSAWSQHRQSTARVLRAHQQYQQNLRRQAALWGDARAISLPATYQPVSSYDGYAELCDAASSAHTTVGCWTSVYDAPTTAADIASVLSSAGATNTTVRCGTDRAVCHVTSGFHDGKLQVLIHAAGTDGGQDCRVQIGVFANLPPGL